MSASRVRTEFLTKIIPKLELIYQCPGTRADERRNMSHRATATLDFIYPAKRRHETHAETREATEGTSGTEAIQSGKEQLQSRPQIREGKHPLQKTAQKIAPGGHTRRKNLGRTDAYKG